MMNGIHRPLASVVFHFVGPPSTNQHQASNDNHGEIVDVYLWLGRWWRGVFKEFADSFRRHNLESDKNNLQGEPKKNNLKVD